MIIISSDLHENTEMAVQDILSYIGLSEYTGPIFKALHRTDVAKRVVSKTEYLDKELSL